MALECGDVRITHATLNCACLCREIYDAVCVINLAEAPQFDDEWRQRTSMFAGRGADNSLGYQQSRSHLQPSQSHRQQHRAIDSQPHR